MEANMDKTVKRCLVASAATHLFLIVVLVVGAAFFVQTEKPIPTERLRFRPSSLIEAALAGGGGNPNIAHTDDVQKGVAHPLAPPVEKTVPPKQQTKLVTPTPPPPTREKVEPVK